MGLRAASLLLLLAMALLLLRASNSLELHVKFQWQHVDPSTTRGDDRYCNRRMRHLMEDLRKEDPNPGKKVWKEKNTFIHAPDHQIAAICTDTGGKDYITKTGRHLRLSTQDFKVTTCTSHGGKPFSNPNYRASSSSRKIVIGCDQQNRPTHLEESLITQN
ncbi:angiogenin-2-like [Pelodiscus sinensis]|uniref:angiogenin-2-like n=1 Tax=Pelodiscus sinensis TaxID=13735 RepID=UPI003F6CBFDA